MSALCTDALSNDSEVSKTKRRRVHASMPLVARLRMSLVVMSIGAGAMFLLSLDSVVNNLQPIAVPFLLGIYRSKSTADIAWEWIVSSRIYGLAVGCLLALLMANYQSRKRPFVCALLINFLGGVLSGLIVYMPSDFGVVICCFGRFACGVGCGIAQVVGSAMLAEIPPIHSRGTVLATLTVWSCMGELAGMIISLDDLLGRPSTWHIAMAMPSFVVPLILFVIMSAPDSPRSLLIAGRTVEALTALKFYQSSADWRVSLADINAEARNLIRAEKLKCVTSPTRVVTVLRNRPQKSLSDQTLNESSKLLKESDSYDSDINIESDDDSDSVCSERGEGFPDETLTFDRGLVALPKPMDIMTRRFRSGNFIRPLMLGAFVLTYAHLDDWLWISYSTPIFENVGMGTREAMRTSLVMSLPQAMISLLLLFGFDEFSRRRLLIVPSIASIGTALTGTVALVSGQNNFWGGALSLKTLIAGLAAFDLSAAAVASESAYTIVPELFSQTDRVLGSAIIGFLQNLFGGFLTTFALSVINIYGTQYVLLPFAIINIFYVIGIYHWLPETNGISFHKISQNFKDKLPSGYVVTVSLIRRIGNVVSTLFTAGCMALGALFTCMPFTRYYSNPTAGGGFVDAICRTVIVVSQFVICALSIHFIKLLISNLIAFSNVASVSTSAIPSS